MDGAADRWLAEGATVGHFLVQHFIAEGAHAQVYLAWDQKLARPVALKVFRIAGEHRELMLAEARLTARFNHPNIVTVHAADVEGELTWLALEFLSGVTLRSLMQPGGLSVMESLRLARSVAEALVEAHRLDVVHADLKPENVLVPEDGRLRVVDFGLARLVGDVEGAAAGSPAYMAPERWKGGAPTPAMDVWSLGVMIHELITGMRPVPDERLGEFATRPTPLQPPPALALLPTGGVIARALSVDPAARPSARELLDALVTATRGDGRGDLQPFRGLRSFTESDAPDLVGRELDVDHALESMRREGFALVVGGSGLGKSSLLAAGLLPRLRESGARCAMFRPGADPLRRLGAALELQPSAMQQLVARPALAATFALRLPRLVILVDQLEEAFTLADAAERESFFEAVRALLAARACRMVFALRDDHLGPLAVALSAKVLAGTVLLEPLANDALAQAILQPLRRVGAGVDSATLAERIVADVSPSPIALPLLQFVCQLLWDARDRRAGVLRLSDYEALGGASGALAGHAERTLGKLTPDDRRRARSLVLRLVTAGGSRMPCREAMLLEAVPGAAPVLARLVEERLLVATRDAEDDSALLELAHEALIASWPSLRRWLEETQEDRTLRDDLEQAAVAGTVSRSATTTPGRVMP